MRGFIGVEPLKNIPNAVISLVAVLNEHNQVLLLKRGSDVHCPNVWSFPGGKVEEKEEPLKAAIRELEEEVGIKGKLWRHIGKHTHVYDDKSLFFVFFFCRYTANKIQQVESEYMWLDLSKLHEVVMPAANKKLIEMLLQCHQEGLFPS
ncbi:MAG: NUDIX domain-containing protein [Ghiorsea sp.]